MPCSTINSLNISSQLCGTIEQVVGGAQTLCYGFIFSSCFMILTNIFNPCCSLSQTVSKWKV